MSIQKRENRTMDIPGRMICTAWNLPAIVQWFASRDPDRYRVYSDWSWFEMTEHKL